MKSSFSQRSLFAAIAATAAFFAVSAAARTHYVPGPDIEPEDLVSQHISSIGTEEARKAVASMTIAGTSKAVFKGRGTGETSGIVVLASQGDQNLIGMKFNNPDYPHEKMGYDGDEFTVGFVRPGVRSILGDFLRINEKSFEIGILGGALSTAWELLDYDEKTGKLKCSDAKKMEDREVYKCRYSPKKGSDLKIDLFFEAGTFRHIKTEYSRVISARQGTSVDNSARQNETRYKMVEDFSDFREEGGLTLPHTYVIYLEILSGNGSTIYQWDMDLQQFQFNNEIDPKEFKVDNY